MNKHRVYWGETHDNTYQFSDAPVSIEESLARAASHLDFYAAAYYTACSEAFRPGGHLAESDASHQLPVEGWKPAARLEQEWREVRDVCRAANTPGRFVTFPGYEWQGNGSSGDHNVFSRREDLAIHRVDTVSELYRLLRGTDALAIPHHTAYRPGVRGRNWDVYDEAMTPFTEIFSIHGCSETDEEWLGLRSNSHMGPGTGAGTWQAALDRGHHVGAVCSTDNWGDMPGHYGRGRMACLAATLDRDSLWEAFKARRVYGVTGDRIALDFTVNEADMGSIIMASDSRRIRVRVVGSDALDRIEILRNGQVLATHCHQGTWQVPRGAQRSRFKLRLEAGWGPRPNELPAQTRQWEARLTVPGGRIEGVEKCWVSPGHGEPRIAGEIVDFGFTTSNSTVTNRWQNANVVEFEAPAAAALLVQVNGLVEQGTVAEFAAGSRELWFRDECVRMLEELKGIAPLSPERMDIYHHLAYKAKIHRAIPETGYTAEFTVEDDEPFRNELNYRVRVEQRNGQRAWSSPVWVTPEGRG
ncbi:MAG: hypothetical protein A3K19_28715 [Lentisphaerae bacterium RIFOXYB12_FULL_65_16]|nr:MAG: hypothetical protein A3K18_01425 [Lentisphaerae bacterium RIFOXYA12_64_32]OGV88262.1 MAG: hypothetical protein A3K19_28715 [Lentisphaerae bacterium RIFOXYB12_FULL_65_16]